MRQPWRSGTVHADGLISQPRYPTRTLLESLLLRWTTGGLIALALVSASAQAQAYLYTSLGRELTENFRLPTVSPANLRSSATSGSSDSSSKTFAIHSLSITVYEADRRAAEDVAARHLASRFSLQYSRDEGERAGRTSSIAAPVSNLSSEMTLDVEQVASPAMASSSGTSLNWVGRRDMASSSSQPALTPAHVDVPDVSTGLLAAEVIWNEVPTVHELEGCDWTGRYPEARVGVNEPFGHLAPRKAITLPRPATPTNPNMPVN